MVQTHKNLHHRSGVGGRHFSLILFNGRQKKDENKTEIRKEKHKTVLNIEAKSNYILASFEKLTHSW